jgi:hypothetical protein
MQGARSAGELDEHSDLVLGEYGSERHYEFVLDQLLDGLCATADAAPE